MSGRTFIRFVHSTGRLCKRKTDWELPDLEKMPGWFRGKVYNKRDWKEFISKNTGMLKDEEAKASAKGQAPPEVKPTPEHWRKMKGLPQYMRNKYALKEKKAKLDLAKTKRLSPAAMDGIRYLKERYPELTTDQLAQFFNISPLAISKILKSRWKPTPKEAARRQAKWEERGRDLIEKKMLDTELQKFIDDKERQLGMEIPYFVKQQLEDYVKLEGYTQLEEVFESLNKARVERIKWQERARRQEMEDS